ncbi:uncharacterized protein LOC122366800 [Amphibalanus amphitrite]|uniref:uncharacterized protein LOC122366800 n=1 Tax=Amphibalanus amphitrite TaxID=1232801 RepID=UPI001C9049A8|nr:uncharacterized protein LOC122366800 [Amphibalanus amphitrite]
MGREGADGSDYIDLSDGAHLAHKPTGSEKSCSGDDAGVSPAARRVHLDRRFGWGRHARWRRGALLIFHQESRTVQLTVAAGKVCSSTRAELVAIREALAEAAGDLPDRPSMLLLLCCDSRAAIQSLQDTADSQSALVAEIRDLLDTITCSGHRLHLQWVPGHAGLPENEEADRLAAIGSSRRQDQIPVDLWSARAAVARRARAMCDARARRSHPHPDPTPGHDGLDRRASVTVAQLRVGCSPLTGDTRHRLGLAESDACVDCGEPDSVPHLLMDCPAHQGLGPAGGAPCRRWGRYSPPKLTSS